MTENLANLLLRDRFSSLSTLSREKEILEPLQRSTTWHGSPRLDLDYALTSERNLTKFARDPVDSRERPLRRPSQERQPLDLL
jgi:hypothetical protein